MLWRGYHTEEFSLQAITRTTYAAADALVARRVQLEILQEMTGHARNRRFCYASRIALFKDTPVPA